MKTKVIFRFWTGSVIALFPELAATNLPTFCESYQRVGQHGAANPEVIIRESRPATEAEYASLKRELETAYEYDLEVVQRLTRRHYETRRDDIKKGQGN